MLSTLKLTMKKVSVVILQHQSCRQQFPHFERVLLQTATVLVQDPSGMTSTTARVLLDSASQ